MSGSSFDTPAYQTRLRTASNSSRQGREDGFTLSLDGRGWGEGADVFSAVSFDVTCIRQYFAVHFYPYGGDPMTTERLDVRLDQERRRKLQELAA